MGAHTMYTDSIAAGELLLNAPPAGVRLSWDAYYCEASRGDCDHARLRALELGFLAALEAAEARQEIFSDPAPYPAGCRASVDASIREYAQNAPHPIPGRCVCRGSGWILHDRDIWVGCGAHYDGQAHPEYDHC